MIRPNAAVPLPPRNPIAPFADRFTRGLICAGLCLVLAGLPGSWAQAGLLGKLLGTAGSTVVSSALSKKTYDADTLKPPDLKACLVQAHALDMQADQLASGHTALEKERSDLDRDAESIKAAAKSPMKDQAAVNRHNKRVRDYNAREKDFNARVGAQNAKVAMVKTGNDAFRSSCAGKRYYASDLDAIRGELPFDVSAQVAQKSK